MSKLSIASIMFIVAACGSKSPEPVGPDPTLAPDAAPAEPVADAAPVAVTPDEPPPPDPAKVKADLLAAETAAYKAAEPVFGKYCAQCHEKGQKGAKAKTLKHFEMTTYPFTGDHGMEIAKEIREVLGVTGEKPTMPKTKPGSVTGDELALIVAWADAFDASHAGGAHDGHSGHKH